MKYISIKIPKVLAERIRSNLDKWGYTSVTDFVVHATRVHLQRYIE